jgi:hypothetical protein
MKYLIVLFKNKERKKIIKKFKTLDRAKGFFNRKIKETNYTFDKKIENGKDCSFELGLLEKNSLNFESYYKKDELGRQVKINLDDSDYKILFIEDYKIEEHLYDISKNKKINFDVFIKEYLPKNSLKLISKLNNKIIIQEDEKINLFSTKSESDCTRFIKILEDHMREKKRTDCLIVVDSSSSQKKYLYNLLESEGVSKKMLYKKSTTHYLGE